MNATVYDGQRPAMETYLKRTKYGVQVDLKVLPEVEDFFRELSGGAIDNVAMFGRHWQSAPTFEADGSQKRPETLQAWVLTWPESRDQSIPPCSLSPVGQALRLNNGLTNLSFLRLVGASRPEGVSFLWNALLSRDELERLADQIIRGQERFYTEFLKPVNIRASINLETL